MTDAAGVTDVGQFHTAASLGTHAGLRFGVAGDWRCELSPYPAISNADKRNLDFFVEHGNDILFGGDRGTTVFGSDGQEQFGLVAGVAPGAGNTININGTPVSRMLHAQQGGSPDATD